MLIRTFLVAFIIAIGSPCSPARAWASDPPAVAVPERSAALIRTILDLRQQAITECGELEDNSNCANGAAYERQQERQEMIWELVVDLTQRSGSHVDEALVVLTCFNLGVAQEESDAIIDRGRRMLPLIDKYRHGRPVVAYRDYHEILRSDTDGHLESVIRLINYGSGVPRESATRSSGEGQVIRVLLR